MENVKVVRRVAAAVVAASAAGLVGVFGLSAPAGAAGAVLRLDSGFGNGGVARVPFRLHGLQGFGTLRPVRQPDGKVLVAAEIYPDQWCEPLQVALVRFKRNGQPDAKFGCGGRVRIGAQWNFRPHAVEVQPDGRIVVMGAAGYGGGWCSPGEPSQVGLIRLLPDGSRDRTFGVNGFVAWNPPRQANTQSMHVSPALFLRQADGRLLAAGGVEELRWEGDPQSPTHVWVPRRLVFVRFKENGSVDESFGRAGVVEQPDPDFFGTWAALPDGRLVALSISGLRRRFTADGVLDPGFGQDEPVRLWKKRYAQLIDVVAANDGSVVAMGQDENNVALPLRRILPEGQLDSAFGTDCARPRLRFRLAGAVATPDGGVLATAQIPPADAGDTLFVRYDARGCVVDRPLRVKALGPGQPLLQGRRTAIASAAYKEGLALIRVRR